MARCAAFRSPCTARSRSPGSSRPTRCGARYVRPAQWSQWSPQITGVDYAPRRLVPGTKGPGAGAARRPPPLRSAGRRRIRRRLDAAGGGGRAPSACTSSSSTSSSLTRRGSAGSERSSSCPGRRRSSSRTCPWPGWLCTDWCLRPPGQCREAGAGGGKSPPHDARPRDLVHRASGARSRRGAGGLRRGRGGLLRSARRPGEAEGVRAAATGTQPRGDPRATLLVEHWDRDDWSRLWWVRAELRHVMEPQPGRVADIAALLAARYPQYAISPSSGCSSCALSA